jgi:protein-S-isoprenylcysteine O-methyltransferase Ste14
MEKKSIIRILFLFLAFFLVFLFLPAGSFKFWEAWGYLLALSVPLALTLFYLIKNDPDLLKRRLRLKEKEEKQKKIVRLFRLPFILGYLIPGFDYRFDWSEVPAILVVISNVMVFLGYLWVYFVFRENSFTSRIVEVEEGQKVISTGPYAVVRHPMYLGIIIMFLFTPLALGSWWALAIFAFIPVILIIRIFNEESVLRKNLPGYMDYCEKTHYRLIPFIW